SGPEPARPVCWSWLSSRPSAARRPAAGTQSTTPRGRQGRDYLYLLGHGNADLLLGRYADAARDFAEGISQNTTYRDLHAGLVAAKAPGAGPSAVDLRPFSARSTPPRSVRISQLRKNGKSAPRSARGCSSSPILAAPHRPRALPGRLPGKCNRNGGSPSPTGCCARRRARPSPPASSRRDRETRSTARRNTHLACA